MRFKLVLILVIIITSGTIACKSTNEKHDSHPVLLISFDGFRHDYLENVATPNFDRFIAEGVRADGLIPIFPTKTFPNHYSIATGLYPEHTGLVGNTMYDTTMGAWYRISDREAVENADWYGGEPIWNTVEKQGGKAGTMFWVGSEAPIQHMRPSYWKPYDGSMGQRARIDTVIKWMSYPDEKRVDFATLYFSEVDHAGHTYGPEAGETRAAVQQADTLLGYLRKALQEQKLWDTTNIIIVSDHGMAPMGADKTILLDTIVSMDNIERITWGAISMIEPKPGKTDAVYKRLQSVDGHYRVFKKEALPDRYHLKDNPRIPSLVLVPDLGYMVIKEKDEQRFKERLPGGMHGYDNKEAAMQGIFFAHGPAFPEGKRVAAFENVHVYELIAQLLNIQPAPNDGSADSTGVLLTKPAM